MSDPDRPPDNDLSKAFAEAAAKLLDVFTGFSDLALGVRRQLLDGGFPAEVADQVAAEYTIQVIRFSFAQMAVVSAKKASPPSLLDLLRRPRE